MVYSINLSLTECGALNTFSALICKILNIALVHFVTIL